MKDPRINGLKGLMEGAPDDSPGVLLSIEAPLA